VYGETPSNPTLAITDLAALAQLAKEHNLISVVDNTFSSPYHSRPLEYGIDIISK
jgi:cystathionine beta-lyase/cystathionine gamma-synthase